MRRGRSWRTRPAQLRALLLSKAIRVSPYRSWLRRKQPISARVLRRCLHVRLKQRSPHLSSLRRRSRCVVFLTSVLSGRAATRRRAGKPPGTPTGRRLECVGCAGALRRQVSAAAPRDIVPVATRWSVNATPVPRSVPRTTASRRSPGTKRPRIDRADAPVSHYNYPARLTDRSIAVGTTAGGTHARHPLDGNPHGRTGDLDRRRRLCGGGVGPSRAPVAARPPARPVHRRPRAADRRRRRAGDPVPVSRHPPRAAGLHRRAGARSALGRRGAIALDGWSPRSEWDPRTSMPHSRKKTTHGRTRDTSPQPFGVITRRRRP